MPNYPSLAHTADNRELTDFKIYHPDTTERLARGYDHKNGRFLYTYAKYADGSERTIYNDKHGNPVPSSRVINWEEGGRPKRDGIHEYFRDADIVQHKFNDGKVGEYYRKKVDNYPAGYHTLTHPDGRIEVAFPSKVRVMHYPNEVQEQTFPDGTKHVKNLKTGRGIIKAGSANRMAGDEIHYGPNGSAILLHRGKKIKGFYTGYKAFSGPDAPNSPNTFISLPENTPSSAEETDPLFEKKYVPNYGTFKNDIPKDFEESKL